MTDHLPSGQNIRDRFQQERDEEMGVPRMHVAADVLLKGSWYAAEQCGHLLHHAAILHRSGAYPTAAAVALLGREELGAHKFLLDQWRTATKWGIGPDANVLKDNLRDHLLKQTCSQILITYMDDGGGRLQEIATRMFAARPESSEYWAASDELEVALRRAAKRAPGSRHSTRLRALYVDLDASGTGWNRPTEVSAREATACLLHAVNDYARDKDNLRPELLIHRDPVLAAALAAWPDKPPLLLPDFDFKLFPWLASTANSS